VPEATVVPGEANWLAAAAPLGMLALKVFQCGKKGSWAARAPCGAPGLLLGAGRRVMVSTPLERRRRWREPPGRTSLRKRSTVAAVVQSPSSALVTHPSKSRAEAGGAGLGGLGQATGSARMVNWRRCRMPRVSVATWPRSRPLDSPLLAGRCTLVKNRTAVRMRTATRMASITRKEPPSSRRKEPRIARIPRTGGFRAIRAIRGLVRDVTSIPPGCGS
jgi:hypothetical protein